MNMESHSLRFRRNLPEIDPGDPEKNHPDLVVLNRALEKAIMADVTISFEGEEDRL